MDNLIRTDTVFGKRVNIVGNISADLVLESLGKIYIKSRNKSQTLEEVITSLVNTDPNVSTSRVKVVEGIEDLDTTGLKEGTFVFDKLSNILYLFIDDELLELINVAPEGTQYVKRSGDTMTGRLAIYVKNGPPLYVNSSSLVENLNAEYLNGETAETFTRRNKDEKIGGMWTFKRPTIFEANTLFEKDIVSNGSIGSPNFSSGFSGYGWRMDADTNTLTVDNLVVRKLMQVYELVVNRISATNGSLWVTNAGKVVQAQKLEIKESSFFSNTEQYIRFAMGLPSQYAFIKLTSNIALQNFDNPNEALSTPSGEGVQIKDCWSIETLKNAKLIVISNSGENLSGQYFDNENASGYHLYPLFSEDFIFDCDFPIITRNDYLEYKYKKENDLEYDIKSYVKFVKSYFKYFAGGDYYYVDFDSDSIPVFKPGDIIRCQKWTYGGIKYYDGVICNVINGSYVIQLADSILDKKTTIQYDASLNPNTVVQKDSTNQTLYESSVRTTKPKDPNSEEELKSIIIGLIEKDDSIVQMGNLWDNQRQNAVYITSTDNGAPYMDVLSGINRPDYSVIYYIPLFKTIKLHITNSNDNPFVGYDNIVPIPYTGDYYVQENNISQYTYFRYNNVEYLAKGNIVPPGVEILYYLNTNPNKDTRLTEDSESYNIGIDSAEHDGQMYDSGRLIIDKVIKDGQTADKGYILLENSRELLQVASTRTTKARLGNLGGIQDELFPLDKQPYGYGLYGQNVFLTGEFYLSNGQSVAEIGKEAISFAVASSIAGKSSLRILERDLKRADDLLKKSVYTKGDLLTAGMRIANDREGHPGIVMWGNKIIIATTENELMGVEDPTALFANGKIRAKFIEVNEIHSVGTEDAKYTRYWLGQKEVFKRYEARNIGDTVIYTTYYYYLDDNDQEVQLSDSQYNSITETEDYKYYGWWLKQDGSGYVANGNINWDTKGSLTIGSSLFLRNGDGIYTYDNDDALVTIIDATKVDTYSQFFTKAKNRTLLSFNNTYSSNSFTDGTYTSNGIVYNKKLIAYKYLSMESTQVDISYVLRGLECYPYSSRSVPNVNILVTFTYSDDSYNSFDYNISGYNYNGVLDVSRVLSSQVSKIEVFLLNSNYDSIYIDGYIEIIGGVAPSQIGGNFAIFKPSQQNVLWIGQDQILLNAGYWYFRISNITGEDGIYVNNWESENGNNIQNINKNKEINLFKAIKTSIAPFKSLFSYTIDLNIYSPRVYYIQNNSGSTVKYYINGDDSIIGIEFTFIRQQGLDNSSQVYYESNIWLCVNKLIPYNQIAQVEVRDHKPIHLKWWPTKLMYLGNNIWKCMDNYAAIDDNSTWS